MSPLLPRDGSSTNILGVANTPILWVFALAVFAVVIIQSLIYMKAAAKAGPAADISQTELRASFRAGAVAAIGPSLAVVLVSIALLSLFGTPAVLTRIGLVGSAATETASASIAAGTMGAELGGVDYTQTVYAVAFTAMSLSGAMWMVCCLIFTPLLRRGDTKLRQVNPGLMAIIPTAALLGAFASLGVAELPKSGVHVITVAASAAVMGMCLFLAKRLQAPWLREWGLGISIVLGLVIAYLAHTAAA